MQNKYYLSFRHKCDFFWASICICRNLFWLIFICRYLTLVSNIYWCLPIFFIIKPTILNVYCSVSFFIEFTNSGWLLFWQSLHSNYLLYDFSLFLSIFHSKERFVVVCTIRNMKTNRIERKGQKQQQQQQ